MVVICLIGVAYAEWYNIVLAYFFCAITLLYALGSVTAHLLTMQRAPEQLSSLAVAVRVCLLCINIIIMYLIT